MTSPLLALTAQLKSPSLISPRLTRQLLHPLTHLAACPHPGLNRSDDTWHPASALGCHCTLSWGFWGTDSSTTRYSPADAQLSAGSSTQAWYGFPIPIHTT